MKLLNRVGNFLSSARLPESRRFWISTSAVVLGIEFILSIALWNWLSGDDSASTAIRNIGFIMAGSVALPLAIWRGVVADKQASAAQRQAGTALQQAAIAQRGLLNERYQRGAEMLGSEVLAVRQGGIYSLRRLTEKYPESYHVQVMRLLCAFVRHPTKDTRIKCDSESDGEQDEQTLRIRADVEDAMQAIGSRSVAGIALEQREGFTLFLREANLSHLEVQDARLSGAWLTKANLSGAIFPRARLSGARLRRTKLTGAELRKADLSDAKFWGADLSEAILRDANLSGADLCGVDARSSRYGEPARGLTQAQLDTACADPQNPPKLDAVVDAETGKPLVWRGKPCKG